MKMTQIPSMFNFFYYSDKLLIILFHFFLFSKEQRKLLTQKYVGIVGKPKWAKITKNKSKQVLLDDEDEDVDLLKVNIIKYIYLNRYLIIN
jgi:hypothetical protein